MYAQKMNAYPFLVGNETVVKKRPLTIEVKRLRRFTAARAWQRKVEPGTGYDFTVLMSSVKIVQKLCFHFFQDEGGPVLLASPYQLI